MSCDAEDVTFLFRKFWLLNRAFRFLSRTFKFLSRTFCLWVASQLALESRRGFGCWIGHFGFYIGHFGFLNRSCWLLKRAFLIVEAVDDPYSFHSFHSRHSLGFLASRLLGFSGGFSALERNTVCLEELSIFRGDTASRTALPWRKIAAYEWKVYCEMKTSLPREHCIFYMKSSECAAIKGYQRVVLAAVWK